jgi:hypothetical protein
MSSQNISDNSQMWHLRLQQITGRTDAPELSPIFHSCAWHFRFLQNCYGLECSVTLRSALQQGMNIYTTIRLISVQKPVRCISFCAPADKAVHCNSVTIYNNLVQTAELLVIMSHNSDASYNYKRQGQCYRGNVCAICCHSHYGIETG